MLGFRVRRFRGLGIEGGVGERTGKSKLHHLEFSAENEGMDPEKSSRLHKILKTNTSTTNINHTDVNSNDAAVIFPFTRPDMVSSFPSAFNTCEV